MPKSTLTRRGETVRTSPAMVAHAAEAATGESRPEPWKPDHLKAVRLVAACLTREQFMDACEEAIRELAYSKWEEAGCPSGDGHDFWLDAEREVVAARSDVMSMRP